MQAQLEFYEEMERQFDDTRQRLQGLKQELSAYEKIMSLLSDHINENLNIQKRLATNNEDERKQTIVKESYDKLLAKYDRFRVSKMDREDDYKRLLSQKNQLESTLNSMKTQIVSIKKLQEAQENQSENIRPKNQHQPQQSDPAFDYDVETINFLNECNWNLGQSCDRNLAETLLSCFPNGTFLVRSSKTKQNSFVLSVVVDSKVRHCLIDKKGDEFCFHPPGPTHQFYATLCNLVMDYRHKSLVCHNPELDTNLIYPVLSQLKKTSKSSPIGVGKGVATAQFN
uniref:Phosphatidylinositol 3-kinase regulatory subunit alpha n=1 Tax=Aceria tosichella TaxID=561515 RepID=A0A6G1SIV2_9ACAR